MSVLETEALAPTATDQPTRALPRVVTASAVLRDLFVVTWAVPLEKVQAMVPSKVSVERLPDSEGNQLGFVQLVFALHDDARWSVLPSAFGSDYRTTTLQVLTRHDERRSAYVLGHFVDSSQVAGSLMAFSQVSHEARYSVYIAGDPARQAFERLALRVTTHALQVHVRAERSEIPESSLLGDWHTAVAFLSRLESQCHPARVPKDGTSLFRMEHAPLAPSPIRLTHQVVRLFDSLELGEPLLAFYQAELPVTALPVKRT